MKPVEGTISARQLFIIVALSRIPILGLSFPAITSGYALQDAWLSAIIASLAGVILGTLAALLARRFPYQSLGTYAKKSLGGVLGTAGLIIFGLYYYLLTLARARELSLLVVSTILPNTPGWVFSLTIIIAALYGVVLGADTLGRSAEVLLTLVGVTIITGTLLLFISGTEGISLLLPVLSRGFRPVAVAAVVPTFEFANSAATVLALGKYCHRPGGMVKAVNLGILLSGIIKVFLAVLVIVSLGPQESQRQLSPMLSLARTVLIQGVFERIDLLLVSIWVLGVVFEVTLFLFTASVVLSDGLGLKLKHTAIFLALLGTFPVALRYTDVFIFFELFSPLPMGLVILTIHISLVGIVFLAAVLRGKGGRNQDA